jgi:CHASE3 domain sensor protein
MTIGKKLYAGFGAVLVVLVLLLITNVIAGIRQKSARNDATQALNSVRTIESVRYQIMINRLSLNNFLLSGDPRDEEKVNKGLTEIGDIIKRGETQWKQRKPAGETISQSRCWLNVIKSIRETPPFRICRSSICRRIPLRG